MDTTLWMVQVLVAVVFALTGTVKLLVDRGQLVGHMRWAASWPPERIKLLGFAEIAGALGLVMPSVTGLAPVLTPVAALCLAALMAGAVKTHRRIGEGALPAVVVGALCVVIAVGRVVLSPVA